MQALLIPLHEVHRQVLPTVGGKAANLGELMQAGFDVPPGFCVTALAYRLAMARLRASIEELVARLEHADPPQVAEIAGQIRRLLREISVPDDLAAVVWDAAEALGPGLAVRSSAVAEDLPEASFAGQMESYLEVSGRDALLDAIKNCWASLWSDRAVNYRLRNRISSRTVEIAVIVQQMVSAEVAGVMFTANPLTGKRTEITIESSFGLGEAVVKGLVTPDSYVVDKQGPKVLSRRVSRKAMKIKRRTSGGTVEVAVDDALASSTSLDDRVALQLAELGVKIEEHFGWPQDVEWALADGHLWLLQSRPITSLYASPPITAPDDLRVYLSFNAVQGIVEPLTPVGASLFIGLAQQGFGKHHDPSPLITLGGRLFIDITPLLRHPLLSHMPRVMLPQVDPLAADAIAGVSQDARVRAAQPSHARLAFAICRQWRIVLPVAFKGFRFMLWPSKAHHHLDGFAVPKVTALRELAYRRGRNTEFRQLIVDLVDGIRAVFLPGLFPLVASGLLCLGMAEALVRRWRLDRSLLLRVRQGLPHNKTTMMDLALWEVARRLREDPPSRDILFTAEPSELVAAYRSGRLPSLFRSEMATFLSTYGHRGIREIDIGMPCWRDDPTYLFGVLRGYTSVEPARAPDKHFADQSLAGEQAVKSLVAQARLSHLGLVKQAVLGFLLSRYRRLGGLREAPKFYVVWLFQALRDSLAAAGARMASEGLVDHASDVRFLTMDEIEHARDGIALRKLVAERRRLYELELGRLRPPRVLTSEGETFYGERLSHSENELVGTGVSPGVAEGTARLVTDPTSASLAHGEILVAPSTDPAWTPLFLTASALIMEAGGMLSHGAIVAREYGIPAVAGVPRATELIKTGQRLQVDGNQGLVRIL